MPRKSNPIDARAFRDALGLFPTGVTVVTTLAADGRKAGLTANSFNSVSLDPPLVLWSLDKRSANLDVYLKAPRYAINILAADQIELSRHFARQHLDKFVGIETTKGLGGVPLLKGCTAWFQCRNLHQYEGGDHVILVGRVERFRETDRPALAFHGGGYKITSHHPEFFDNAVPVAGGGFTDDYLLYLLARASHLASGQFHTRLKPLGIAVLQWRVLASAGDHKGIAISKLADMVLAQQPTVTKLVDRMARLRLIERRPSRDDRRKVLVHITPRGRKLLARLRPLAKAHEAEIIAGYDIAEWTRFKAALRTFILRLGTRQAARTRDKSRRGARR